MHAGKGEAAAVKNAATVERTSDTELVVSRTVSGPARLVFDAWTKPELFRRWWVPKSFPVNLVSCEMNAQTGGTYRLVFTHPSSPDPIAFFGTYKEVTPHARVVWTNEEAGEGGAVTTVTFTERGGDTLVVMSDRYPSKSALDEAIASGSTSGNVETFEQLEALLVSQTAS